MLLFLEQGILSEMFYFKLLTKSSNVNIKSEALNTFFLLKKRLLVDNEILLLPGRYTM
jgi:hypothetical protein